MKSQSQAFSFTADQNTILLNSKACRGNISHLTNLIAADQECFITEENES
jgi:hypothetical protein